MKLATFFKKAFYPKKYKMEKGEILRGYIAQLLNGCDSACKCENEYCKSCEKFKYEFHDKNEGAQEGIKLAQNHSKEDHLCRGLSYLQLNNTLRTTAKNFPSIEKFSNLNELDKKEVISMMTNFKLIPYIFEGEQPQTLNDQQLNAIGEVISNNLEYFEPLKNALEILLKDVTNDPRDTKERGRLLIVLMFYFSLFPVNDLSPLFCKLLQHIFQRKEETVKYIQDQCATAQLTVKRILWFAQDNLTFSAISGDFKPDQVEDEKIVCIVKLITLFRMACPYIPSFEFSNEVFTDHFMDVGKELEKYLDKKGILFLKHPAILTLPFKFTCLSQSNAIIQSLSGRQFLLERLLQMNLNSNPVVFTIQVSRDNIVDDTIDKLSKANPNELSKRLSVVFQGEQGVDAGGVSREFFYLLCNELFSAKYGLFYQIDNGKYWFVTPFVGRMIDYQALGTIVALAVYNSIILPIRFPQLLYKKLCHMKATLDDYKEIDPEICESLENLKRMKNSGQDISSASLTFSVTQDNYGELVDIDLCEDGQNRTVTNDNLDEYIELYADWLMNKSIQMQYSKFEQGFNKVAKSQNTIESIEPLNLYKLIYFDELDILVSGEEIIHWNQLKEHCKYSDGYTANSAQVKWFWEIFDEMTNDEKKLFFRFSTGSDRAPVGGLDELKFVIQKINDPNKLPVSHTCFNIFSLPCYSSKEEMKKKIMISIQNTEGFGLI